MKMNPRSSFIHHTHQHATVMLLPIQAPRRGGGIEDEQWDEDEVLVPFRHHCVSQGGGGYHVLSSQSSYSLSSLIFDSLLPFWIKATASASDE